MGIGDIGTGFFRPSAYGKLKKREDLVFPFLFFTYLSLYNNFYQMVKFEVSQKEREGIILLYESYGILLEATIWGALARVAKSWLGKNSDEIAESFKKTEIALAKELDDIVSTSFRYKNLTEIDNLKAKLMHFYNPGGEPENIEAAKNGVKMFLNGYAKSRGKNNFQEYIDEITIEKNKVKNPNNKSKTPFKFIGNFKSKDGRKGVITASYHQWYERFGSMNFEQIKKMYNRYGKNTRLGVPNILIKEVIIRNLEKISQSYVNVTPQFQNKYPRIHVIKNRVAENNQQGNPPYFNFIEFIIIKTPGNKFEIVTSSFSEDGKFLKFFGDTATETPKLMLEKMFYFDCTIII